MAKYLEYNGLSYFWSKLKDFFAKKTEVLFLTGGTLTGPLNGTTATFSGNVSGNNATFSGDVNADGDIVALGEVQAAERLVVNADENNYGAIRFNSEHAAYDGVRFYGNNDQFGDEIVVGAGGVFVAGAGESAWNLHNALIDAGGNPDNEESYITADNSIYLFSHCGTIENRTQLMLNNSSNVALYGRCGADHAVNIGTSANNGVTANTVIGTIEFQDKNSTWGSKFYSEAFGSSGRVQAVVAAHNKKTDGTEVTNYFTVCADKDGTQRYTISNQANFRSAIAAANAPTQLYNNTSGVTGNVTLSDSAANYNYLRIFFYGKSTASGSATKYECVEVYAPNGKIAQLSCTGQGKSGDLGVIFFSKMVTISAKAVSSTSYCSASIDSGGTTCAKNNEIYITRVEGWN